MNEILRKIKIYFKDAYYIIFKYPSDTELRIQKLQREGIESENTRLDQHYQSYAALKKRHKRIKEFFLSLIPISILIIIVAFVVITFALNMLFSMLGIENNPFHLSSIFATLINCFKNCF
jgi:hypothetical protein